MKFGFGKRIAGFVLAAAVAAGTFLSTPATAKAAAPLAKGIDVSKYQGAVNWSAVKNAGYSFAFIKAGSAKSGLDPYYAVNMAGATAAGMKVGVYIYSYATTVEGAMTEAQFAIAAMEPYSVSYPVVYDLEDSIHKTCLPISWSVDGGILQHRTAGRLLSDGLFQQKLDGRQDRGNPL